MFIYFIERENFIHIYIDNIYKNTHACNTVYI